MALQLQLLLSGQLNEHGILKAQFEENQEEGVGLDETVDFDEYTIHDAQLNEYGILKPERYSVLLAYAIWRTCPNVFFTGIRRIFG